MKGRTPKRLRMGGGNDEEDEEKEANKEALALSHTRVLRCPDSSTKSRSIGVSFPPSLRSRQSFWFVGFLLPSFSLSVRPSLSAESSCSTAAARRPFGARRRRCGHGAWPLSPHCLPAIPFPPLSRRRGRTRGETVTVGCDATCKSGRA